jgi:hypothetical protein
MAAFVADHVWTIVGIVAPLDARERPRAQADPN